MATYKDDLLTVKDSSMRSRFAGVEARCGGVCLECKFGSLTDEKFMYTHGDIILAGIISLKKI